MQRETVIPNKYYLIFLWVLILFGLYLTSLDSYLLFHSLAEIFSIVVACGIFMITWNSRQFLENNYLLFIGIAYLFVGGLDLIHTLAYKGMGVFQGYGANLSTQLWVASRYIESLSLLIAPLFLGRKLRSRLAFIGYSLVAILLLGSIFYWGIFPDCFVEGIGLTSFKKTSEYIISLILLGSIFLLVKNQQEFDKVILQLLVTSIFLTIAAELAFTLYVSVYGISNLVGHFCKIISFYLIYKAIIETGLRKPYDLLFRNLKQSEKALRGREAILREVIDLVPHAIYANDRNGLHLLANRKAAQLLGTTVEDLTGALFEDVFHNQEQLNHFLVDTREVIDSGQPKLIPEEPITDSDGNLQFLQTTKMPFTWPDTGERVVLGVSVVITALKTAEGELKKAHSELERRVKERTAELVKANAQLKLEIEERQKVERELRMSESRLNAAQQIAEIGSWDRDLEADTLYWSDEQYRIWGYEPGEVTPSHDLVRGHIHADDLEMFEEAHKEAFHSKEPYDLEYRIVRKDWAFRTVHSIARVEWDETGKPIRHYGCLQDITERKKAEEALRESEEKYRFLVENIPSIVYTGFKDWSITFTDNKIEVLTGYDSDDFNSRRMKWSDLLLEDDFEAARESFIRALQGDIPYVREYRIRTKGENILWIQDRGRIICNDKGEIEYISGVFFDVTERKQAEEALRKSEEELRLLSSQLLTTQENERGRIARELHDGIGQYLSAIKYKLEDVLGHVEKGISDSILKSLGSIIPLIQDTVEEVRRITMDLRPSTLDDLGILATIAWFSREFQKTYSNIHVDREINLEENDVPDSLKIVIYRVLQEALNNVAKHSKANTVCVSFGKTDGNIELAVEDNGKGFELEEALSVEGSKRGFGLGSMKERTELSGGIFVIDSVKGRGTVLQASWPIAGGQK